MASGNDLGLDDLDHRGGEWLRGGGTRGDIVISSRVRLARNLAGFPFLARASDDQKREILDRLKVPVSRLALRTRPHWIDVEGAGETIGSFLVERHLISRELQHGSGPRAVAFGSDEAVSVMINEEDHIRIQSIRTSLDIEETWRVALAVDRALEAEVDFAVSTRYGYLTACPTNVGTGLRASVMLHLPAMVQMKQIEKLFNAAHRTGLAVRGFYGEGTMASGDLYQISNQVTLGVTEEAILQGLQTILPTILDYEVKCREELVSDRRRLQVEDRCQRALALLRAARLLTSDEAMSNLSTVRLGVALGILPGMDLTRVNELFVLIQPAHIQKMRGEPIDPPARDSVRAAFVRENLA
ncbi:MAG: protein arginine kinase [Planctomycetota bacterium]|nr:protein arginine kinase [Planctomycetota bacterium]